MIDSTVVELIRSFENAGLRLHNSYAGRVLTSGTHERPLFVLKTRSLTRPARQDSIIIEQD